MKKPTFSIGLLVISIFIGLFATTQSTYALSEECKPVEAVFVPGSGQDITNYSAESNSFRDTLAQYLKPIKIDHTFYRLGSQPQTDSDGNTFQYPAQAIGLQHPLVSQRAYITNGYGYEYVASAKISV